MLADEVDDLVHPSARSEDLAHAQFLEPGNVFVGNYPAPEDYDVVETGLSSELDDPRKDCHVSA